MPIPAAVQVSPESEIHFELSKAEATPKAVIKLEHPGGDVGPVAFKVKTTQPRRYLVRPNQGIIAPKSTETVEIQILLVEKDKNALHQSFLRLGQAALDNCKDKFLVQSTAASKDLSPGDYDGLTEFWTKLASNPTDPSFPAITNKKLTVVHKGIADEKSDDRGVKAVASTSESELEQMKKKYDELVQFSVNLTAERDVLNNTLEQTKRDLNRHMTRLAANDNAGAAGGAADRSLGGSGKSSGFSLSSLVVVAFICWLMGCYMQAQGKASFLQTIPVIGSNFDASSASASDSPLKTEEL